MGGAGHPKTPSGGCPRLADLTPHDLIDRIAAICAQSPIVVAYSVRTLDLDIFSLRVHLIDNSFIEVFYNVATGKTAFALIIVEGHRVYGKDNQDEIACALSRQS